jgi:hypothetical protein
MASMTFSTNLPQDECKRRLEALMDRSSFLHWRSGAKPRPWVGQCDGEHFSFYHRPGVLERQEPVRWNGSFAQSGQGTQIVVETTGGPGLILGAFGLIALGMLVLCLVSGTYTILMTLIPLGLGAAAFSAMIMGSIERNAEHVFDLMTKTLEAQLNTSDIWD